MRRLLLSCVVGVIGLLTVAGLAALATQTAFPWQTPSAALEARPGPLLARFASASAFRRYVESLRNRRSGSGDLLTYDVMEEPPAAEMAMAPPAIEAAPAARMEPGNPAITNTQTIGVDEGGIVKQIGRFLVVLQDGRLFSADLGGGGGARLRLADRIDVYRSPHSAASWYDEMLVLGDRILVTAYNYREQASEITVVRMDAAGRLSREGRYLLSSSDYYSTENYATRLVGDNLVFYAPHELEGADPRGDFRWPRIRRADGDGEANRGEALIGPTDVYAPAGEIDYPVLHTVSVCPLRRGMDCRTTAFIGPAMREFYVSPTDAFLWVGAPDGLPWEIDYANRRRHDCAADESWSDPSEQSAMLYRLPLDGGEAGAVALDGIPADQFAFDSRDGRFRALLARPGGGCTKFGAIAPLFLLDLPLSDFGARVRHVANRAYSPLPAIGGGTLENRFVGPWLVYGGRSGWSGAPEDEAAPAGSALIAVPLARPAGAVRLRLPHNAIRIERAGEDAVVTGYRDRNGLSLSYVRLAGARPHLASTTMLAHRFESEGRSHAFNAWIRADGSGLIGLPTTLREARAGRGWSDSESSALSFIAVAPDKALSSAGELAPRPREQAPAYRCQVSCVDWYGNSRPIFTGGRIFALMGTDLVEGRMERGRIGEVGRLDMTGPPAVARRGRAR